MHCLTVPLLEIQRGAGRNKVGPRSRSIISVVTGLRFCSTGTVQRVLNRDGLLLEMDFSSPSSANCTGSVER